MNYSKRINLFKIIIYSFAIVLIFSLFQIQVFHAGKFARQSEKNRIRLLPLPAPRGQIYDRNGLVLATNRLAYHVYVTPEDFDSQDLPKLSKLIDLNADELKKRLSGPRMRSSTPILIKRDISKELAMKIEERKPELAGVFIQSEGIRFYPNGEINGHLLGYIGKITKEEYQKFDRENFGLHSYLGRAGLEKSFDSLLRGEDGGRQIEVNARGEQLKILSEKLPFAGENLSLSIDLALEREVYPAMSGKRSSVVMMDLRTGEIVLMISNPGFDPNVFVDEDKEEERLRVLKDKRRPLVNRATTGVYPPGSVFKLVTGLAGLESGKVTPFTSFQCNGYFRLTPNSRKFKCWEHQGHGSVNLFKALERSCNVYFYNVGRLVGEKELEKYSRLFGLGEALPLEVPTAEGLIPSSQWKKDKLHDSWYLGETVTFAIGQGYVLTTPVQILNLISIVATDGKAPMPTLLKVDSEQQIKRTSFETHEEAFRIIKQGMLKVVESKYGTGQLARLDFMRLAAKTGTAQAPPEKSHAWFASFFPYEKPEYALVVFVEHGGSGGLVAATLAKQVLAAWQKLYAADGQFEKPKLPPVVLKEPIG